MNVVNKEMNRRKRRLWIWPVVLLPLLAGVGFVVRAKLQPVKTIDPTKLATAERGEIAKSVVATGKIEPRAKVQVKSKASGIVQKILVDYGEYVKQGQVLAELDKEDLRARVREAKAAIQAALAAEESAAAAYERNKVEAEGPDIPFLKSNVDRSRRMHEQGLLARNAQEESERLYELALNKRNVAVRNVAVSKAEIARAKAQVAQAQANLDRAEEDLRNSTITSPMDGLVLSRDVEVGDAVSSILVLGSQATLVMTLGDVGDVYVLGKVDQADIGRVRLGQPARISVESFKDKRFEGAVTKISPLGVEKDNVTTFEVRVSIKNPGGVLKAMMSANAEIVEELRPNAVLIPEAAVIYEKKTADCKGPGVCGAVEVPDPVSESGKRRIPVHVGVANGVRAQILDGLKPGDKVVLQ